MNPPGERFQSVILILMSCNAKWEGKGREGKGLSFPFLPPLLSFSFPFLSFPKDKIRKEQVYPHLSFFSFLFLSYLILYYIILSFPLKGKERKGKERKGKERKGRERKEKKRKGKERIGWVLFHNDGTCVLSQQRVEFYCVGHHLVPLYVDTILCGVNSLLAWEQFSYTIPYGDIRLAILFFSLLAWEQFSFAPVAYPVLHPLPSPHNISSLTPLGT